MTKTGDAAEEKPGQNRTVQTAVAFIDLLGLSNRLADLDRISSEGLSSDESLEVVRKSVGAIRSMRSQFEDFYREVDDDGGLRKHAESLPGGGRKAFLRSLEHNTRISWFSDCAFINVPIDRRNILACCRGLMLLLSGVSIATIGLLAQGQLLRGGIETGLGVDRGDDEILGSGMVHAHELEAKVAVYPRVCVGPRLLGFLTALRTGEGMEPANLSAEERLLVRDQTEHIEQFIVEDFDGVPKVDPVCRPILKALVASGRTAFLEDAQAHLEGQLAQLDITRSIAHRPKLTYSLKSILMAQKRLADLDLE